MKVLKNCSNQFADIHRYVLVDTVQLERRTACIYRYFKYGLCDYDDMSLN